MNAPLHTTLDRARLPAHAAFGTEALQLFVQERFVDMTDPLVQLSGAVIGWTIIRRAGYRPYGETHP